MRGAEFALLLGFALLKVTIGLTLVWLGFRGGGAADEDDGFREWEPDAPTPPVLPPPRRRRRRRERVARGRGRPVRSIPRRPPRRREPAAREAEGE